MKKILVILGHPYKDSFNDALSEAYIKGVKSNGNAEIKKIVLSELKFDPILWYGYSKEQKLEPHLEKAQEMITWADHLVFIYPIWWGHMPSLLKGFIERTFLPGYAFKYRKDGKVDKFLTGKTAHIIKTSGGPPIMYKVPGASDNTIWKHIILGFTGIKLKKVTHLGPIKNKLDKSKIKKFIKIINECGKKLI